MQLLYLSLFIVVFFALAVLAVSFVKNCPAREATLVIKNYLKDIFDVLLKPEPPAKQFYPTLVGYDGNRILPQLVDTEFESVRKNFDVCYCMQAAVSNDENCVAYRFSIQRKPDSPDDESLTMLIQKQAEEIVAGTMRLYDCYLPAEPLTVVDLFPAELRVAFARTEDGVQKIAGLKRSIRRRRLMAVAKKHDGMRESWNDSEKPE